MTSRHITGSLPILGLLAGGDESSLSVHKGIEWLIEHQRADGLWDESLSTGTGFPKVFYLSYHLYRNSFPLLALGGFLKGRMQGSDQALSRSTV